MYKCYVRVAQFAREQLSVTRRTLDERHEYRIRGAYLLAQAISKDPVCQASKSDRAEAESLMSYAVDMWQRVLGPRHPETVCAAEYLEELRDAIALSNKADEARARLAER